MTEAAEEVDLAWVCEFCKGASGKPRASPGSRRCTSNAAPHHCRDALAAARVRDKEELAASKGARKKRAREALEETQQMPGYAAIIAAKDCFAIKEVLGVSYINLESLSEGEQRGGVDASDYCHEYLVRGGFGDAGDQKDALMPGTRWVSLADLIMNCSSATELTLLDGFDRKLAEDMATARRMMREEIAERASAEQERGGG